MTNPSLEQKSVWQRYKERISCYFLRMPLGWRLLSWYALFLSVLFLILLAFSVQFLNVWHLYEIDADVQKEVKATMENPFSYSPNRSDIYIGVYNANKDFVSGTFPLLFPKDSPYSPNYIKSVYIDQTTFFYIDIPFKNASFSGYIRAIVPALRIYRQSANMLVYLDLGGLAYIFLATLGGYFLIYLGLRPVRQMTKLAKGIGVSIDISSRLPLPKSYDELYDLTTTFNAMLDRMQHSQERERRFSLDVSHELRTPLTVIQAESDYGRYYTSSIEEAKESFEGIFKQCKRMSEIIHEMLEIARLEYVDSLSTTQIDLSAFIQDIVQDYARLFSSANLHITTSIQENIHIIGNESLLRRAVMNYIDNAMTHTKDSIHIDLSIDETKHPLISVTDNGKGLRPEEVVQIWDRLYQTEASRTSKSNKGFGLGLYFVHHIMKLHGGQALVTSTPHVATTFSLQFKEILESKKITK